VKPTWKSRITSVHILLGRIIHMLLFHFKEAEKCKRACDTIILTTTIQFLSTVTQPQEKYVRTLLKKYGFINPK
jgi:hypothetical protein